MSSWLCGKDKYPYSLQGKAKENWHSCWSHQSWEHAGKAQSCQSLPIKDTLPILISKTLSSLSAIICLFLPSPFNFLLFVFLLLIFIWAKISLSWRTKTDFPWIEAKSFCMCVFVPLFYGNPVLTRAYEGITPMSIRAVPQTPFLHIFLHKTHRRLRTLRFLSPLPIPSSKELKVNTGGAPASWLAREVQFHLSFHFSEARPWRHPWHCPSSLCLTVHARCLTNTRPGLSHTLCQPLCLFLPPKPETENSSLKDYQKLFFWNRDLCNKSPVNKFRPTKSKGSPGKVRLKWTKCSFVQLSQPREDMGLMHSSQPSSAVTDAAWNWRRNDDAGLFPSRCRSVTMEADSVLSTSLSAK